MYAMSISSSPLTPLRPTHTERSKMVKWKTVVDSEERGAYITGMERGGDKKLISVERTGLMYGSAATSTGGSTTRLYNYDILSYREKMIVLI